MNGNNTELYHYGVKGMKWGVRRYQNPDGSMTNAGKKKYAANRDSDELAKRLAKHTEAYAVFDTNTKRYYNPSTGRTINVGDPGHSKKALATKTTYESFKEALKKKYDSVDAKADIKYDKGKAYVTATLQKKGVKYVSELEADFNAVSDEHMRSLYLLFEGY